tara:strand:+ start:89 stop:469 length:381 start_codon:yes stop_codon:yes gene_type:complete
MAQPLGPVHVPNVEPEYDDEPDVMINVYQGKQGGYGITCTQQEFGPIIATVVTAVDAASEASKAGVQKGDRLVRVMDLDGNLPKDAPGEFVVLRRENFSETLAWVRQAKHCRFGFLSAALSGGAFG